MPNNACDLDTPVPDWIIEHPASLAVFEELGIDYCCAGKSLAYACRERNLSTKEVLEKLHQRLTNNATNSPKESNNGHPACKAG